MKKALLIILIGLSFSTYGQVKSYEKPVVPNQPDFYLDSVKVPIQSLLYIDPSKERDMVVEKGNKKNQYGSMYFKFKNPEELKLLSLKQIEKNYTGAVATTTLFMLNDEFLMDELACYKVDSSYILDVLMLKSSKVEYLKSKSPEFTILNIRLKTKENIEKANTIMIRGSNELVKRD